VTVKKDICSVRMDFEDNGVLALLIGEHNQNLAHLEQRLDVSLNSFGNSIKIKGKADAVKRTQSALEDMYRTINETGAAALEASLIDDVVRWAENGVDAPVAHRGGVALDTWKKKIVAKTKGQKAYVDLLQGE
jgi:phosphate starvation-inducible PhoH-like protein